MAAAPITIGELTNVPAPLSPIDAQWAQDVSSRVVQRFATTALLKAWAAPTGATAVALDTGVVWQKLPTGWSQVTPWATSQLGIAVPMVASATGTYDLATVTIPADPSANRVAHVSCLLRVMAVCAAAPTVFITQSGTNVLLWNKTPTIDIATIGGTTLAHIVSLSGVLSLPANTAVPIVLKFAHTQNQTQIDAGSNINRLDVLVVPRG